MGGFNFFLASHGSFSKIDHMLCHKASLRKCKKKKIGILPCVLSDHNGLRVLINHKIKKRNYPNTWRLHNIQLNKTRITKNIREEIKKNS